MSEDFVGMGGSLEEEFVYAPNNKLRTEAFISFEQRAALEKPVLMPGLKLLKKKWAHLILKNISIVLKI